MGWGQKAPLCWFTPHMPTMALAEMEARRQEPSPGLLGRWPGLNYLNHHCCLRARQQEAGTGGRAGT